MCSVCVLYGRGVCCVCVRVRALCICEGACEFVMSNTFFKEQVMKTTILGCCLPPSISASIPRKLYTQLEV